VELSDLQQALGDNPSRCHIEQEVASDIAGVRGAKLMRS
jgi:hypothetical protein